MILAREERSNGGREEVREGVVERERVSMEGTERKGTKCLK